jgi:Phage integrase, N-terminal SAM-like domain
VDKSITQLGQDLALAKYAKTTRESYVRTAEHLSGRFKRPLTDLTREELRMYVEELTSRGKSASWLRMHLAALLFLYRKTLGRADLVSFVSLPKRRCLRDPRPLAPSETWRERLVRLTGRDLSVCPQCGGRLVALPLPLARAPPPGAAA